MCSHYQLKEEDVKVFSKTPGFDASQRIPFDIYPSCLAPVIYLGKEGVSLRYATFGYTGFDKPILNARIETILERPLFKEDFQCHRCIVPMSSFFEFDKSKKAHQFIGKAGLLFALGIYRKNQFCILTTTPDEVVGQVHHRSPFIITKEMIRRYLNSEATYDEIVKLQRNYSLLQVGQKQGTLF